MKKSISSDVKTALAFLAFCFIGCSPQKKASEPLLCYVGGTMRPAVEKLAEMYEKKTGIKVEIDYSSSGEAMIKAKQTGRGDLIVVHDPYEGAILGQKLGDTSWTVAELAGVIVVPKGNPKNITGLKDLLKPDTKLVLSDAVYSTLGNILTYTAKKHGIKEQLEANIVTRSRGSGDAANAVMVGNADAAVVWNAVAFLRSEKLDAIEIEPEYRLETGVDAVTTATFGNIDMSRVRVTVARLASSKQPEAAAGFAAFMNSQEGKKVWDELGFLPVREEKVISSTEISGEILVHCAAGMRKPVSEIGGLFEKSTGVKTEISYDGTNRLLGQIELSRRGDVYIAGDADYIDMARDKGLVLRSETMCRFVPVLLVKKGNPKKLTGLESLTSKGVKFGIGDEKSAAVGRITPSIFKAHSIDHSEWKKNVVLSTPTVHELGNALKLGTIDATIVWNATALDYADIAEVMSIDESKNIIPDVGIAVLSCSSNKTAAQAFLDFVTNAESREILENMGFSVNRS